MERTLNLALHKYVPIPPTLRAAPASNDAAKSVKVGLANLFHHYYLDSFGRAPPNPDPAQFEHVQFLMPCQDFRFQGEGLGISSALKRNRSAELGHAFLRWFLHDHLGMTYFAHMDSVLDRQLRRPFDKCRIERVAAGDAPDYFCADVARRVFLGEAKGRYTSISFDNKEFAGWREQFTRVVYYDASGAARSIKGHIVATRFATEKSSRVHSGIWAEDPASPGQRPLALDEAGELAGTILSLHYSSVAQKLWQPLLASALATGVPLPAELGIVGTIWEVVSGPLEKRRFVGGDFGADDLVPTARKGLLERPNPFRLDQPGFTFFGVEEGIFREVVAMARTSDRSNARISPFEQTAFFDSAFSVLRDGSALGPLEYFYPQQSETF